MNKEEYLAQLRHYLKRLPQKEYENAMEHFTEYFDEAGAENEEKVIAELGSPKEAASELLGNLLEQKTEIPSHRRSVGIVMLIAVIALLVSPIGFPYLCLGLLNIFAAIVIIAFVVLLTLASDVTLLSICFELLVNGIRRIPYSISGACVMVGTGIFGIGFSILSNLLVFVFCKWLIHILLRTIKKITKKRGDYNA